MDGTVGRESDPEEADWHEDAADLTHDEPGFRPNGAVLLDLLEGEPIPTRQLRGKGRGYMLNTCSKMAVTMRR